MIERNPECAEASNPNLIVAIGASAGGFSEIVTIVKTLPVDFAGTLIIATHRYPNHENVLARILADKARVCVAEPADEDCLECTTIYVGKSDERVEVDGEEFDVEVDRSKCARMHRIDDLFVSVDQSAGENAVGIILSGMLSDGVVGLKAIHDAGGHCVIQSPKDAQSADMPINALAEVDPSFPGTTDEICRYLAELAKGRQCQ
jgi:two-component system chemotaxis response regulator CheB